MDTSLGEPTPPSASESRIEVYVTTGTSAAPAGKAHEPKLYVMRDPADPDGSRLYFTQAEWDAFEAGVRDGEFDLDQDDNLPPIGLRPAHAERGPGGNRPDPFCMLVTKPPSSELCG